MTGFVPTWLAVAQCVVAGAVLGVSALSWAWWRDDLRRSGAAWTLAWSGGLAMVCLLNGLLGAVPAGAATEALLLLRFLALGASVTLALPAVHALTGGPRVRPWVLAVGAWYLAGAVLWLGTDLVVGRGAAAGEVVGPLATAVQVAPLAAVGLYVGMSVRGRRLTLMGGLLTVSGVVSAALLLASTIPPPTPVSAVLAGVWVLPLVVALHVLAGARVAAVRATQARRARMRDTVTAVGHAAWLLRTPEQVRDRALADCRVVLGDPTLECILRPLSRDRYVAEFHSAERGTGDLDERAFLRDLARVVSNAAERFALTERLQLTAFTDPVTGLSNRLGLDRHLARTVQRANVERTRVAVLVCDVDGLRHVNHRLGHEGGDEVLGAASRRLVELAGEGTFVARYGGDEFVVVVERADADQRALASTLRAPFGVPGSDVAAVTMSIGVAVWEPGDVVDPDALVRDADLAMAEAKRSHTGVAVYDTALRTRVAEQMALHRLLQAGIGDGEIVALFQPLSDAATLEVVGLEVLARWRRDGALLPPSEWLPFAEESGLIVDVGRQIFRAAREGMELFDLPVAVNVAARQLDEPDFVAHVEESWGTDRWDRLTIEVTESALLYDAAHVRAALATLAARGVKIAIDDFGTGYNSLSRLGELPLHILKIDRTFVHDVGSPAGSAVLRAILALARAHALEVVAEGVEHVDELVALVDMGVDTVQGYMLGRPSAEVPVRGNRATSVAASPAAAHLRAVRSLRPS